MLSFWERHCCRCCGGMGVEACWIGCWIGVCVEHCCFGDGDDVGWVDDECVEVESTPPVNNPANNLAQHSKKNHPSLG